MTQPKNTVVTIQPPSTLTQQVTSSPAAKIAARPTPGPANAGPAPGAAPGPANAGPAPQLSVQTSARRGEYIALGGRRKSRKGKSKKSKKSKGKSKKSKSRK